MCDAQKAVKWVTRIDEDGSVYWYRRDGLTEAVVRRVHLEGYQEWQYVVGVGEYTSTDYASSVRAAKIRATKMMRWFKMRECFYAVIQPKLRLLLQSGRIEDDRVPEDDTPIGKPELVKERGIVWQWDQSQCKWDHDGWRLYWDQVHGWLLQYPDGKRQLLRGTTRVVAMDEAAFWIRRHPKISE